MEDIPGAVRSVLAQKLLDSLENPSRPGTPRTLDVPPRLPGKAFAIMDAG
jgi:hypothetical protein